jgi:hypothetical protein
MGGTLIDLALCLGACVAVGCAASAGGYLLGLRQVRREVRKVAGPIALELFLANLPEHVALTLPESLEAALHLSRRTN